MTEDGLDVTIAMALERATEMSATEIISDFSQYADPDALNRLFRVPPDEDPLLSGQVTLAIEGHHVRIASDGVIDIEPL